MRTLPTISTLQPLLRRNLSASNKNPRAVLTASHCSGPHHGLRTSPTVMKNLAPDFASAHRTYWRRVYSKCFCMLHNESDAEDAAQEVFLQLFRKMHTFRGESSFSTWLHRLTTNCVLMEIRRKRHRAFEVTPRETLFGAGVGNEDLDPPLDSFQTPSTHIFERVIIGTAVSQLPTGFQRIFKLHDVEGYTHEEIAKLLGIQVGTSKSQLHKARLRMRVLLQSGAGGTKN